MNGTPLTCNYNLTKNINLKNDLHADRNFGPDKKINVYGIPETKYFSFLYNNDRLYNTENQC